MGIKKCYKTVLFQKSMRGQRYVMVEENSVIFCIGQKERNRRVAINTQEGGEFSRMVRDRVLRKGRQLECESSKTKIFTKGGIRYESKE